MSTFHVQTAHIEHLEDLDPGTRIKMSESIRHFQFFLLQVNVSARSKNSHKAGGGKAGSQSAPGASRPQSGGAGAGPGHDPARLPPAGRGSQVTRRPQQVVGARASGESILSCRN